MKIAIVSNTTFNIYNFRLGLVKFLLEKQYEVVIISPPDEYVESVKQETKATYIPLLSLSRKGYNPFSDLNLLKELYGIYRREKIGLAISYTIKPNIYSALAGYMSGTKTIVNLTGLGFVFLKNNLGNKIAKHIYKFSLRFAHIIVFQNKTDKLYFETNRLCHPDKTTLINGSGINLQNYQPAIVNKVNAPFQFLFVGRLLFDKGIREFIAACSRLHQENNTIQFHMVGGMDEGNPSAIQPEEMRTWQAENPNLIYHGVQFDVKPFINACDVVVLPSYREGIPRVLLEAMAMAKPFVTTKVPGCEDVTLEGVNGYLAEAKSSDSLFEQMKRIFNLSAEERKQLGLSGRKRAEEKYDEKMIVEDYLKLILRLSV